MVEGKEEGVLRQCRMVRGIARMICVQCPQGMAVADKEIFPDTERTLRIERKSVPAARVGRRRVGAGNDVAPDQQRAGAVVAVPAGDRGCADNVEIGVSIGPHDVIDNLPALPGCVPAGLQSNARARIIVDITVADDQRRRPIECNATSHGGDGVDNFHGVNVYPGVCTLNGRIAMVPDDEPLEDPVSCPGHGNDPLGGRRGRPGEGHVADGHVVGARHCAEQRAADRDLQTAPGRGAGRCVQTNGQSTF